MSSAADGPAILIRFDRDGRIACMPVTTSDVEGEELARRLAELVRLFLENPSWIRRAAAGRALEPER